VLTGPHVLNFESRVFTLDAVVFLPWSPPSAQNPVITPDASGAPVQRTSVHYSQRAAPGRGARDGRRPGRALRL
ncbi:MAG: hypothetical protein KJ018_06985, partial [Burkholderiales bacterium]|nr:hypothetical protein [Burkholderiales bacterium]